MTVIDMSASSCDFFAIDRIDVNKCDVRRVSPAHSKSKPEGSNLDSGVFCDERHSNQQPSSPAPNRLAPVPSPSGTFAHPEEALVPSASKLQLSSHQEHDVPSWSVFQLQNEEGDTCLHVTIVQEVTASIPTLIRTVPHRSFLNIKNDDGHTPLHVAVLTGQAHVVRWLLAAGADASKQDRHGNTALHLACSSGEICCAKAYLSHFLQDNCNDVLTEESTRCSVDDFPTCRRKSKTTPKELAESSKRTKPIMSHSKLLIPAIRKEISVEKLFTTSKNKAHVKSSLRQLLEIRNFDGEMSVHVATARGDVNALRLLFCSGADTCAKEGKSGNTVLHIAIERRIDCVSQYVINECVDIQRLLEARNYAGLTAYELALVIDTDLAVKINDKRALIHKNVILSEKRI